MKQTRLLWPALAVALSAFGMQAHAQTNSGTDRGVPGVNVDVGKNASDKGVPGVEANVGKDGDQKNLPSDRTASTDQSSSGSSSMGVDTRASGAAGSATTDTQGRTRADRN